MKTICMTLAALLLTALLRAEEPKPKIDPAELKTVPNISLAEQSSELAGNVGKIVRLRFGNRTAKPVAIEGDKSVVEVTHEVLKRGQRSTEVISLAVPQEGAAWLGKVPTVGRPGSAEFVYVRITSAKPARAEALGREIKPGMKGPELVW